MLAPHVRWPEDFLHAFNVQESLITPPRVCAVVIEKATPRRSLSWGGRLFSRAAYMPHIHAAFRHSFVRPACWERIIINIEHVRKVHAKWRWEAAVVIVGPDAPRPLPFLGSGDHSGRCRGLLPKPRQPCCLTWAAIDCGGRS